MTDLSATFDPNTYDSTFIADLVAFVGADDFQTLFEAFFIQYAVEFSDDNEHRLRYTEIYEKFQNLFESQLEIFCKTKNINPKDFVKRCRELSSKDTQTQKYIDILLSSVEYETFVRLMQFMKPIAIERHKIGKNNIIEATSADPKGTRSKSNKDSKDLEDISTTQAPITPGGGASSKGLPTTSPKSAGSKGTPSESKENPLANRGGHAKGGSK